MRTVRRSTGPFAEQPYYTSDEMERMCCEALLETDLLPATPKPVRIDRFVEKRFGCAPEYMELPTGILGFTQFSRDGVARIVISKALDEDPSSVTKRRERSTLAHEAGHGLFHSHLFVLEEHPTLLPKEGATPSIMCREEVENQNGSEVSRRGKAAVPRSRTPWHEYQANQAIGGLLLPRALVREVAAPYLLGNGKLGATQLPESARQRLVEELMGVFDVNRPVASFRLEQLYPLTDMEQLSL